MQPFLHRAKWPFLGLHFLRSLRFSSIALCVILAAWLTPASADVIYEGGAPDQGGQIFSELPDAAAMTFQLAPGETDITGVNWWGGCYPATTCGSSPFFEITIWSDNSGVPGSVLDFAPVGDGNQTATGNLIGGHQRMGRIRLQRVGSGVY